MISIAPEMIYPMVALALWTFVVVLRNLQVRVAAMRKGELKENYFELMQGGEPSAVVVQTGNHLRNLFEFPVLFYAVCLVITVTGQVDNAFVWLAWAYVACRVLHSVVHLSFNKVTPRFAAFFVSTIILLAMWIRLALSL